MDTSRPVLVIGSGISGLTVAAHLADQGLPVLLITKTAWTETNSYRAQGGIAASCADDDSPDAHATDTMRVARGLADPERVRLLTSEAAEAVAPLLEDRVFAVGSDARPDLAREAGHRQPRILHAADGMTGRAVMASVHRRVAQSNRVNVVHARVVSIANSGDRVVGVWIVRDGQPEFVAGRETVVATGGMAGLYAMSSNPSASRGEGLWLAYQAGATLADLEFLQFHPTLLWHEKQPGLLLTEALRGAGAHLVDASGERILANHPDGELAPRDVVAQAVFFHHPVFLTLRHVPHTVVGRHFQALSEKLQQLGWDLARDVIPVVPGAHFSMGGVVTDEYGRTGVRGLWAVGEVSMMGIHGANRLASNSLLEGLVFGRRVAEAIGGSEAEPFRDLRERGPDLKVGDWMGPSELPELMDRFVGVVRTGEGLSAFLMQLESWPQSPMTDLARWMCTSALERRESRGSHFRRDFPNTNDDAFTGHFYHQRDRGLWYAPRSTAIE